MNNIPPIPPYAVVPSWPFPVLRFDNAPSNSMTSAPVSFTPEIAGKFFSLKRKLSAMSGRRPEKKLLKAEVKKMRTEHPGLSLKPGALWGFVEPPRGEPVMVGDQKLKAEKKVSAVQDETKTDEKAENLIPITIGLGEKQIRLDISENEKTRLVSHATFFQFLLDSTLAEFDPSPLELSLNSDPEIVHSLILHAINDEQIDVSIVQKELRFEYLQKLYDAAYELQMSKYLEQIKKLSLADCMETEGRGKKYAKFRIIGEKMQPHTVSDLNELYSIGLKYPNLMKILRLGSQLRLDPSSNLHYMLSFMDQHREEHSIDQYTITPYGNKSNERINYFLKTLDYWLPQLKKLEMQFFIEEETEGNPALSLGSIINLNIGLFARLEELTISGDFDLDDSITGLNEYFPNLQKIIFDFSPGEELFTELISHPSLKTIVGQSTFAHQSGDSPLEFFERVIEYSRDDVSQPFEKKE